MPKNVFATIRTVAIVMLQQIRMFKAQTCDDDESLIDILSKV